MCCCCMSRPFKLVTFRSSQINNNTVTADTIKAYRLKGSIAVFIVRLRIRCVVHLLCPSRFTSGKQTRFLLRRRLPVWTFWRREEVSAPGGIQTPDLWDRSLVTIPTRLSLGIIIFDSSQIIFLLRYNICFYFRNRNSLWNTSSFYMCVFSEVNTCSGETYILRW